MGSNETQASDESAALVQRAAGGDQQAVQELFARHRDRLKRMVHLRLSRRLQGRVDDSDVLQEAFLNISTQLRDADREVTLHRGALPEADSMSLAAHLLGQLTTPSQAAIKAETRLMVQEALNSMDPIDREVLALKHFEQLSTSEIAEVLGMSKAGAGSRYLRAIKRLKEILSQIPGFME